MHAAAQHPSHGETPHHGGPCLRGAASARGPAAGLLYDEPLEDPWGYAGYLQPARLQTGPLLHAAGVRLEPIVSLTI